MESEDKIKKLEEELREKLGSKVSSLPVIDRALVIGYLARLSEKELHDLLTEVKRLRNGVWKPLEETKRYKTDKKVLKNPRKRHKVMGLKVKR